WYKENIYPALLEPAFANTEDPIERIFELLGRYRNLILQTDCTYGCPIGRLALEVSPSQRAVHEKIAENFLGWTAAVRQCLLDAGERLPADLDRDQLSTFILTVMEGGVMQSRSHRSVKPFDESVAQLRDYFSRLLGENRGSFPASKTSAAAKPNRKGIAVKTQAEKPRDTGKPGPKGGITNGDKKDDQA